MGTALGRHALSFGSAGSSSSSATQKQKRLEAVGEEEEHEQDRDASSRHVVPAALRLLPQQQPALRASASSAAVSWSAHPHQPQDMDGREDASSRKSCSSAGPRPSILGRTSAQQAAQTGPKAPQYQPGLPAQPSASRSPWCSQQALA